MKFNFSLDDLNKHFDDSEIMNAEDLLDMPAIWKGMTEVEKGLWVTNIQENDTLLEAEIQINGNRLKSARCECPDFEQNRTCTHLAAAVLYLKRQRDAKKNAQITAREIKKTAAETPQKLTIPNILKRVPHEALIAFVSDYARSDKQFSLALKTRFADELTGNNNHEHYKQLIDNTLKNTKSAKGGITPKGWQQIFTILEELKSKINIHFVTSEFQSGFELLRLFMPLLHRFMRSKDAPYNKLERRQVQIIEILRGADIALMSPELHESFYELLYAEYVLNIRYLHSEAIFDRLLHFTDTKDRNEKTLQFIDNQIVDLSQRIKQRNILVVQDIENKALYNRIMLHKVKFLQKNGRNEEADTLILSSSDSPEVLMLTIENVFQKNDFLLVKRLCEIGMRNYGKTLYVVNNLNKYLYIVAEKQQDTEGVLFYGEKMLILTLLPEYFDTLKKAHIKSENIENIIKKIETLPYRTEKRDILAHIFMTEKRYEAFESLVRNLQSLELLKRYGLDFFRHNAEKALDLHSFIFSEYLITHLGRPPAQRIRQVIESFFEQNAEDFAQKLIDILKNKFPERLSLNEEIDTMLTARERRNALRDLI